ncbi:MAG: PAS domain-containing protein [Capsulimonadales bacterium]|nr:PAS domain-containing protein [Capsulimonadales bacterium]
MPSEPHPKKRTPAAYWSPARSIALGVAGLALISAGIVSLVQRRTRDKYLEEQQRRREQEVIALVNAERFRLASEAVNGLIYDWDPETGAVLRTRGLTELLGYLGREDQDTMAWWREQIHPEDRERVAAAFEAVRDHHRPSFEIEYRVRHKSGQYVRLQDRGVILRDAGGKAVRVVGCSIDVTARYEAERALRYSEERLRLAVTGADLGTWHWNLRTDRFELSDRCRRHFGIAPEEEVDSERFFRAAPSDDREWVRAAALLAIEQGQDFDVEHRVVLPDGSFRWLAVRGRAHADEASVPMSMEGIALDVTERHLALSEIEKLNVRLQRAMAESHHRIKNNLQTLAALAEMQSFHQDNTVPREAFERLCQHIRTLASLHDLLTLEIREFREVETVSVRNALNRLTDLLSSVTGNRTVLVDSEEARLPLKQAGSFSLLVNELVSNAVKHGAGDIRIRLRTTADRINGQRPTALLEVTDEGAGFPPGFDPRVAANTGLELVESIGCWDLQGAVAYENAPGGGAMVRVSFPLQPV